MKGTRVLFALTAALAFSVPPSAIAEECDTSGIERALAVPVDGLKMLEREVKDIQSTEGGVWRIYKAADGQVRSIVRLDGGESGMSERRLAIVSPGAYGITVTRIDYLRHAFIDNGGPNGTAKRTTEYFYFCSGKLVVPLVEYATMDVAEYAKAGEDARQAMVQAADIAEFTANLAR